MVVLGLVVFLFLIIFFLMVSLGVNTLGKKYGKKKLAENLISTPFGVIVSIISAIISFFIVHFFGNAPPDKLQTTDRIELEMNLPVLEGKRNGGVMLFTVHGDPLWWCRIDATRDSGFRCFNKAGRDPHTNELLFPISHDVVRSAIENIYQTSVQVAQTSNHKNEIENHSQPKIKNQLSDKYIFLGEKVVPTTISISLGSAPDFDFSSSLREALKIQNREVFRNSAYTEGVFQRLTLGDKAIMDKLPLSLVANTIILGTLSESFTPIEAIKGSVKSKASIYLVSINTKSAVFDWRKKISVEVLAHNQDMASKKARDELLYKTISFLQNKDIRDNL